MKKNQREENVVPKREMKKINWIVMCSGIVITLIGYALVSPITRDYETSQAFFAILTLNLGLLITILGLGLPFSKRENDSIDLNY